MKRWSFLFAVTVGLLSNAAFAEGDTLLIQRVQAEKGTPLPARGASMAQVEAKFGAPSQKFEPVAGPGPRKNNPPITRWQYANFNVYFEYSHVVDAVLIKSNPNEIGPAPVQK